MSDLFDLYDGASAQTSFAMLEDDIQDGEVLEMIVLEPVFPKDETERVYNEQKAADEVAADLGEAPEQITPSAKNSGLGIRCAMISRDNGTNEEKFTDVWLNPDGQITQSPPVRHIFSFYQSNPQEILAKNKFSEVKGVVGWNDKEDKLIVQNFFPKPQVQVWQKGSYEDFKDDVVKQTADPDTWMKLQADYEQNQREWQGAISGWETYTSQQAASFCLSALAARYMIGNINPETKKWVPIIPSTGTVFRVRAKRSGEGGKYVNFNTFKWDNEGRKFVPTVKFGSAYQDKESIQIAEDILSVRELEKQARKAEKVKLEVENEPSF